METSFLLAVGASFLAAGFVKGVVGLGLPTVAMGTLSLVMPPVQAAALLIVPSMVTNVWQLAAGSGLRALGGFAKVDYFEPASVKCEGW